MRILPQASPRKLLVAPPRRVGRERSSLWKFGIPSSNRDEPPPAEPSGSRSCLARSSPIPGCRRGPARFSARWSAQTLPFSLPKADKRLEQLVCEWTDRLPDRHRRSGFRLSTCRSFTRDDHLATLPPVPPGSRSAAGYRSRAPACGYRHAASMCWDFDVNRHLLKFRSASGSIRSPAQCCSPAERSQSASACAGRDNSSRESTRSVSRFTAIRISWYSSSRCEEFKSESARNSAFARTAVSGCRRSCEIEPAMRPIVASRSLSIRLCCVSRRRVAHAGEGFGQLDNLAAAAGQRGKRKISRSQARLPLPRVFPAAG